MLRPSKAQSGSANAGNDSTAPNSIGKFASVPTANEKLCHLLSETSNGNCSMSQGNEMVFTGAR
jgi:hypothetical protein